MNVNCWEYGGVFIFGHKGFMWTINAILVHLISSTKWRDVKKTPQNQPSSWLFQNKKAGKQKLSLQSIARGTEDIWGGSCIGKREDEEWVPSFDHNYYYYAISLLINYLFILQIPHWYRLDSNSDQAWDKMGGKWYWSIQFNCFMKV